MNNRIITLLCLLVLLFSCEKPITGYTIPGPSYPTSGNNNGNGNSGNNNNGNENNGNENSGNENTGNENGDIAEVSGPDGYVIVGYATYWDSAIPDPALLTHINYAFAHIKNDYKNLDIKTPSRLETIAKLKNKNRNLKVMLSVGGWEAGNFSEMAASSTNRKEFCKNCLAAINKYGLDGIDLDWEYPTSSQAGISSSDKDDDNFTLLIKDLRETLGPDKLITMASASNAKYVHFKDFIKYMNFVNIMSYDMGDPPEHNSGLYHSSKTYRSCDEAVKLHLNAGVPAEKLVMGIPFYGHGDGKAFKDYIYYNQINTAGYNVKWDADACVPYLTDNSGNMVLTYDDETSVGLKAEYVKENGLAGAMYWNIEADDASWTLAKAVSSRLIGTGTTTEQIPEYQVTNPYVQKYLEEVQYSDRDYTYSYITDYPGGGPSTVDADIPPVVKLTWTASSSAGSLKLKVWDDQWSRDYSLSSGASSCELRNLVPGRIYEYLVSGSSGTVVAKGKFKTTGLLHQAYFEPNVHNVRDLGGWKTDDGHTVAFRKVYRGGRMNSNDGTLDKVNKTLNDAGRAEAKAICIGADLDLRADGETPPYSPLGQNAPFCAPHFSHSGGTMLREEPWRSRIKTAFEFVVENLRNNVGVYYHCAAGRDRTGTFTVVLLGVLGVSEGDISKDYELSYFAPEEWSMNSSDNGVFTHTRVDGMKSPCNWIWNTYGPGTFKERVEKYLLDIDVKQKDIDDYRRLMLE